MPGGVGGEGYLGGFDGDPELLGEYLDDLDDGGLRVEGERRGDAEGGRGDDEVEALLGGGEVVVGVGGEGGEEEGAGGAGEAVGGDGALGVEEEEGAVGRGDEEEVEGGGEVGVLVVERGEEVVDAEFGGHCDGEGFLGGSGGGWVGSGRVGSG